MNLNEKLKHTINSKIDRDVWLQKKRFNIKSFSRLVTTDVAKLKFNKIERRVLLYETKIGEKIYIQFPGKETELKKDKRRPWDFKPIFVSKTNVILPNLSFEDIMNDISSINYSKKHYFPLLAALLYRFSIMLDSKIVDDNLKFQDIDIENNNIVHHGGLKFQWYKLFISDDVLKRLNDDFGEIRKGYSLEGYLYYYDLLTQNEDCKYFYRNSYIKIINTQTNETFSHNQNEKVGRHNTYTSQITMIGANRNKTSTNEIAGKFVKGRGVAPASLKDVEDITDGIIKKDK